MSVFVIFALTVIPLIFTPGPDMLFILSQVASQDAKAGMKATVGICLWYLVHSVCVALGIAAIIVSFPVLFETIRWLGIGYLLFLAFGLIKSVFNQKKSKYCTTDSKRFFYSIIESERNIDLFCNLTAIHRQDR